ncbi:MAG: plasmid stabilization protein [Acetobacterium sp. MES1]|uniref:type II toxin-antitoxin system RelE/ParE family toxin n=1 Tax=Acetobacterium sp. MES1 TaxID=1899015 RepID=UPI000B9CAA8A|nr:type II toxin-antitoxin system RelE/ParE family toxin [Acetobacterium sp. MES1]OXS24935.1 MAG: plasmid stabilization protein [Acetobacterium sp. MES1]
MAKLIILPPAARYLKELNDKHLKLAYQKAMDQLLIDHTLGTAKTGDLSGIFGYNIYYNQTNYELAYRIEYQDDKIIIVIMAGTRENFYQQLKRYMKK